MARGLQSRPRAETSVITHCAQKLLFLCITSLLLCLYITLRNQLHICILDARAGPKVHLILNKNPIVNLV